MDDFVQWLSARGYSDASINQYSRILPLLLGWLRRRNIFTLKQLNLHWLQEAYCYYRPRNDHFSRVIRC